MRGEEESPEAGLLVFLLSGDRREAPARGRRPKEAELGSYRKLNGGSASFRLSGDRREIAARGWGS